MTTNIAYENYRLSVFTIGKSISRMSGGRAP